MSACAAKRGQKKPERCGWRARTTSSRMATSFTFDSTFECRGLLRAELDALGQRQIDSPVDGVGLPSHIRFPGVRAGLAAAAGFLLAAKRAADFSAGGTDVDI